MHKGRRVLPTAIGVAIVAAVLCALLWRYEVVRVAGASMRPTLLHGDLTVVEKHATPRAGDIVLLQEPGRSPVLHRALRRTGGGWITKGDANPVADWAIAPGSWLQGRVVAVIPAGRMLERWR